MSLIPGSACEEVHGDGEKERLDGWSRNFNSETSPTLQQLDDEIAAMEGSEGDRCSGLFQLRRQRNALVSIHCLPGELFVSILHRVAKYNEPGFDRENERLHTLTQVSTYWLDTIFSFPIFWYQLAQYHPPSFREAVLKRNRVGLLNIDCVLAQNHCGPAYFPLLDFMRTVAPLSERWKMLGFEGDLTDEMSELLQRPAPNLEGLLISSWANSTASRYFHLGEGTNIKYLDIDNLALVPWNSTRLRGLRGLQIQHLAGVVPSLAELHAMLASSPELWWIQLSNWSPRGDGACLSDASHQSNWTPIYLPYLTTIVLHGVPASITELMLSNVIAPECQCLILRQVPPAVLWNQVSSDNFSNLLNGSLRAIGRLRVLLHMDRDLIHLLSDPPRCISYNWIHHVDEQPGLNVQIRTNEVTNDQLGRFLGSLALSDEVYLVTDVRESRGGSCPESSLMHARWDRVRRLHVSSLLAAEIVSRQLSSSSVFSPSQSRLQTFSSPLHSDRRRPDDCKSIAKNLATYVQQTTLRKEAVNGLPSNAVKTTSLEIIMPRRTTERLRGWLRNWDVQLSELKHAPRRERSRPPTPTAIKMQEEDSRIGESQ